MAEKRDAWSGRLGFMLATIGSAVGIGSIWKFPYEVGSNGGGAFVLFYLAGLALVVVPLMFAEFAIGRRGRGDPYTSIAAVAQAGRVSPRWGLIGLLGVLTGFLILTFYAVIGGWMLGYALETATQGLAGASPQAARARYDAFLGSPWRMLACHAAFMAITALIVARGVAGGIERACMVLMPLLGALMLALAAYAVIEGDFAATLRYLFLPDFSQVSARTALAALGLGFFSIGVGMGPMITYAAYAREEVDLRQVAIWSVAADTAVSLLAGFAVFPIVFAHGLDPAGGPGLVFVTLPLAFAGMPFGQLAAIAFFTLLFVAALASAISLFELPVALLTRSTRLGRGAASALAAGLCFLAGIATVLSFSLWSGWHPLAGAAWSGSLAGATVFGLLDYLTSNMLLPLSGFCVAVFAGWVMPPRVLTEELGLGSAAARGLLLLMRWVVPAAIAAVGLVSVLGSG